MNTQYDAPPVVFFLLQSQHYHLHTFPLPLWFEALHQNTSIYGKREAPEGYITHFAEHFQLSMAQQSVHGAGNIYHMGHKRLLPERLQNSLPHPLPLAQGMLALRRSEKLCINSML